MSELDWAKGEVKAGTDHENTTKALQILADASANLALRPNLQDDDFFAKLLECFSKTAIPSETSFDPDLLRNILRCMGNLVADNGKSINPGLFGQHSHVAQRTTDLWSFQIKNTWTP